MDDLDLLVVAVAADRIAVVEASFVVLVGCLVVVGI